MDLYSLQLDLSPFGDLSPTATADESPRRPAHMSRPAAYASALTAAAAATARAATQSRYATPRSDEEDDDDADFSSDDDEEDDDASSVSSAGASSRCATPEVFEPLPLFGGASAASPLRLGGAASALSLFPRRVHAPAPGAKVFRAAVVQRAQIVEASAVVGAVVPAIVPRDFGGSPRTAVPARLPQPAGARAGSSWSVASSSDDAQSLDLRRARRVRLNSVASTASTPSSPSSDATGATAAWSFGFADVAPRAATVLGKRRAPGAGAPAPKRYRNSSDELPAIRRPLYLVGRGPSAHAIGSHSFAVADGEGAVETVTVGMEPSCTCRAHAGGSLCQHLAFVLVRVLKAPASSPALQRVRITMAELNGLFEAAPQNPASAVNRERHARAAAPFGGAGAVVSREATGGRDCTVCCQAFGAEELTFCRTGCGLNFHKRCHAVWNQHNSAGAGTKKAHAAEQCPVCRCRWASEDLASPVSFSQGFFAADTPPLFDLEGDVDAMMAF